MCFNLNHLILIHSLFDSGESDALRIIAFDMTPYKVTIRNTILLQLDKRSRTLFFFVLGRNEEVTTTTGFGCHDQNKCVLSFRGRAMSTQCVHHGIGDPNPTGLLQYAMGPKSVRRVCTTPA